MYKGFALAVLLIAPLLVMLADSFKPKEGTAPVAAATPTAVPVKAAASGAGNRPLSSQTPPPPLDPLTSAGLPSTDAGKPMLDPSQPADGTPAPQPSLSVNTAPAADVAQMQASAALTAEWKNDRR